MALSFDSYGNLTGSCDIFCLHFLPDLRQIRTFKFPKVVRQGNILKESWQIIHGFSLKFPSLSSGKTLENRLRFDEASAMSLEAAFYFLVFLCMSQHACGLKN